MGQPTWRDVKTVSVPERKGRVWTPALDYLTPGRLYKIQVDPQAEEPAIAESPEPAAAPVQQDPATPPEPEQAAAHGGKQAGRAQPAAAQQPTPVDQVWTPESAPTACTADGDTSGLSRGKDPLLLPDIRVGALIARIGGSTADQAGDKERAVLFAIGRHCVFQAPEPPKIGTLYLGINDTLSCAANAKGQLLVRISEAL